MNGRSVSVIIPAFRAARTIGRAVDSLLAQIRLPDEIFVIDDGSPDDLYSTLKGYGDRITLVRKPNGGAASARNLGIERSKGDLIAFLDADDYWESIKLERQLAIFRDHPEVGLVASRFFEQPPGRPRVGPPAEASPLFDRVLVASGAEAFQVATRVWTSTVIVRRAALGSHRFVSGLEPAEDRDLWVRVITSRPVYLISEPLATAVLEPGSLSRSSVDTDCANMLRVVRRHGDLLGRSGLRTREADVFRRWAGIHLGSGRPLTALGPAWRRLVRQPLSPQAWWILLKCCSLACAPMRLRVWDSAREPDLRSGAPVGPSME
jgi:glycosyltransferase involved in cell wall biosynthesis